MPITLYYSAKPTVEAEVWFPCSFDVKVRIVKRFICDSGKEQDNYSETIISFEKYFLTEEAAQEWMKKDKLFKATLKNAIKYA